MKHRGVQHIDLVVERMIKFPCELQKKVVDMLGSIAHLVCTKGVNDSSLLLSMVVKLVIIEKGEEERSVIDAQCPTCTSTILTLVLAPQS